MKVPLKRLAQAIGGAAFPPGLQGNSQGELPFYKVKSLGQGHVRGELVLSEDSISRDIAKGLRANVIPQGSLVMAKIGAALMLGRVRSLPAPSCIDNNMIALVPSGHAYPRFLYYLLQSVRVEEFAQPGAVPSLDVRAFLEQRVDAPCMREQSRIADYLDRETATIDALIEKQKELVRLSRTRRVLTVDAVLEELWASAPQVSVKSLTSTHGLVDGDWVESKDQDSEGRVRLTQLADVGDGFFRDRSDRWVNDETFDRLRCFALKAGDILIARMPDPIGRACVVPALPYRAITVVDVAVLRPVPHVDSRYLTYVLNGSRVRGAFESLQDGGACQMVCVSRTERNGKNHDHDRREEPRRALGPGPGRAAESLRAA